MHSKSGNKIIEQINTFSEKEAFRAYLMAMKQYDFDLGLNILRQLSHDKRRKVERYFTLYQLKIMALNALLVTKATLAIGFYNTFASKSLGLTTVAKNMEGAFDILTKGKKEEKEMWEQKLQEIENESEGVLKLDEFEDMKLLSKFFEYWQFIDDYSTIDEFVRLQKESV